MDKLIINFTPTGMIPTKEMTPHVPISVNEIMRIANENLFMPPKSTWFEPKLVDGLLSHKI